MKATLRNGGVTPRHFGLRAATTICYSYRTIRSDDYREANEMILLLAGLAHVVSRHRRKVIAAWVLLTLFGVFAAGQVKRWYQSFSIPG